MTLNKNHVNPYVGSKQALLSIHQFAQVCRTTPRTLRFYEQKGLFKPAKVDQWNKYRLYHPRQARDFLKIRLLQNFHIPLKQITKSLKKNTAEGYLQKKLNELREEIKEKEKEYKFLKGISYFLFQQDINDCHAELDSASRSKSHTAPRSRNKFGMTEKTFGPYNLFCMKVEHGEYAKITEYIKALWQEAKKLKLECEPTEITFYLDNRYDPKNTPLEIALILKSTSKESFGTHRMVHPFGHLRGADSNLTMKQFNNDFYLKSYPKTKALVYNYTGPYEYLIVVYQKLYSHISSRNVDLKGLVFETYKYGPLNTKSKYDYQTLIGFPI